MNVENLSQILDELALRFGSTGARLWEDLVRYEVVSSVTEAGTALLLFLCFGALTFYLIRKAQDPEVSYNTQDPLKITAFMAGVFAFVCLIITLTTFPHAITAFLAPEAATLKGLLP